MELPEVRKKIDQVDKEIRELFVERMMLADQVAVIKAKTGDAIYKPDREEVIIRMQTEGMKPRLMKEYTALIKRIMEISRKYQYGRTVELRNCFPCTYEKQAQKIERLAIRKDELYVCDTFSKDEAVIVDSYEEMARDLRSGKADAGIGIMEEIGVGVSDELHHILAENEFYITNCVIRQENGRKKKVVTFANKLEVLPEHNRIKIMFSCANRSGSLGSILSMIADYGVNLTEIHSRPFEEGEAWNYLFFAELSANIDSGEIHALLYQLSQETLHFKILGSYCCEGDV